MGTEPGRIRKNAVTHDIKKIPGPWLVIIVLFLCELFIYTGIRVDCTRNRFQIFQAQETGKRALTYQKELIIERDRLEAPERISKIARTRLGLEMPGQDQVVYME